MRSEIKRSKIFTEFTDEEQYEYFYCKEDKVINNIDTLYYTCFIENDKNENEQFQVLTNELIAYKSSLRTSNLQSIQFKDSEFYVTRHIHSIYKYCLSIDNYFDVLITDYLPNNSTPRLCVQLRSIALWTKGVTFSLIDSYLKISDFLKGYNIEIIATRENRIDYCYHTNSIQNPEVYFSDLSIKQRIDSELVRYTKIGERGKNYISYDYLAFGNKNANNVFVRMYNKTKEVIDLNYKCVFFDIWKEHALISNYDKYIYEYCYVNNSYAQVPIAKCMWYLEFGKDEEMKKQCEEWINIYLENPSQLEKILKGVFPKLTIIYNVEYQTMRKFYKTADNMIQLFSVFNDTNQPISRVFQIVDNRSIFLEYLTTKTFRFVEDNTEKIKKGHKPRYLRFWRLIVSNKVTKFTDEELKREYVRNVDIEKIKTQIVSKIATLSIYKNKNESGNFKEDLSDLLSILNDNDMKNIVLVDSSTGEIVNTKNTRNYKLKKEQKYKSLKTLLNPSSPTLK